MTMDGLELHNLAYGIRHRQIWSVMSYFKIKEVGKFEIIGVDYLNLLERNLYKLITQLVTITIIVQEVKEWSKCELTKKVNTN